MRLICEKIVSEVGQRTAVESVLPEAIRLMRPVSFESGIVFYGAEILE